MFGLIITGIVGLYLIRLGLMIWKKEKISFIHYYHYTKVKEEDKKAYTTLMGQGILIIGIGCVLTGVIDYLTPTSYVWLCFAMFSIIGFMFIVKAQKKFNGGFF